MTLVPLNFLEEVGRGSSSNAIIALGNDLKARALEQRNVRSLLSLSLESYLLGNTEALTHLTQRLDDIVQIPKELETLLFEVLAGGWSSIPNNILFKKLNLFFDHNLTLSKESPLLNKTYNLFSILYQDDAEIKTQELNEFLVENVQKLDPSEKKQVQQLKKLYDQFPCYTAIRSILNNGQNPKVASYSLCRALATENKELALMSLHPNLHPDFKDENNQTPLTLAARKNLPEMIRFLCERLLNDPDRNNKINITEEHDLTALHLASFFGHKEIVEILSGESGLDPNPVDEWGETPLIKAAGAGHLAVVKALLGLEGILINQKSKNGETALIRAAVKGNIDLVKLLSNLNEIDLNLQDNEGNTALIRAAIKGDADIVDFLSDLDGIDLNLQNNRGSTALINAVEKGHIDLVRLLVQKPNIDVNILNVFDDSALSLAYQCVNSRYQKNRDVFLDIIRLLEDNGAL